MSTSNQKSIASFFQIPKCPRPPESQVETTDNRPSKSIRISISNRSNIVFDGLESKKNDTDSEVELLSVEESSTSHTISTTGTKKSNNRISLWKNKYSELFKWLKYDPLKGTAWCSYSSCKMYWIWFIIKLIKEPRQEQRWNDICLSNMKRQRNTEIMVDSWDKQL